MDYVIGQIQVRRVVDCYKDGEHWVERHPSVQFAEDWSTGMTAEEKEEISRTLHHIAVRLHPGEPEPKIGSSPPG